MDPIGTLRTVIVGVDDMDAAVEFWTTTVGLPLKFRDGDRYAALDAGGVTVALAAGDQRPPDGATALSFKVADVAAAVAALQQGGATVTTPPQDGPHETRAALRAASGGTLFVYAPR